LSNQIVKIVKAGTFYTVEMSIELLETFGSSCQGIKASYQGIALAMPQALRNHMPLSGPINHRLFQHPLGAIPGVFWCGA
jgi:hypothetical protein